MSRKFKPYISISVNYDGSSNLDSILIEKSIKFKGSRGGSGYCFVSGVRDINFIFKSIDDAASFAKAARRFKAVKEITKQAVLERDD